MTDNTQQEETFFDLHTQGIGYLNRARTVKPQRGQSFKPYEAVTIASFHGSSRNPSYSYFDTEIVGSDALEFVKEHNDSINNRDCKVLVRFKAGDGVPDSYVATSGSNKDVRYHFIKSRLLQITWASINGEVVLDTKKTVEHGHGGDMGSVEGEQSSAESLNAPSPGGEKSEKDNKSASTPTTAVLEQESKRPTSLKEVYSLAPDDPNFLAKKAWLEKNGYRDKGDNSWRRESESAAA